MKRLSALLAALFLCAAAGCRESPEFSTGQAAPDFDLPLLSGAPRQIRLSEAARENPVLLVFWASWCPACVEEIPELNGWYEEYAPRGLRLLGINVAESPWQILKFMRLQPIRYPVLLDKDGAVANLYGVAGIPAAVLIAKGGKIQYYGFSLPRNIESFLEPKERKKDEP